jgi:sterol desaturase/sphingolipid hydroxylase (fatty acid hydroxylase superfamily)
MHSHLAHPFAAYRGIIFLITFALIALEIVWNWRRQHNYYNLKESAANISILIGFQLSKLVSAGYQLLILGFVGSYMPYHLPQTAPVFILTFFVIDFLYYWYHRISHHVKFFWAFHLVHHSSPWMNLTTSYRLNWFSALVSPLFFIPAVLAGLPPTFIGGSFALNLLYQFFMHTEAVRRVPLLEGIINTPSAHRVHHGRNDVYIDRNFGGVVMIWDRLFGTYQAETEPVQYGITTGFVSHNPLKLVFHGFSDFVRGKMNYKG